MSRAAELRAILEDCTTGEQLHQQLIELITRWDIEDDPPSAGRALQRQLELDYIGALQRLFQLHEDDQRLLARAYCAYYDQIDGAEILTPAIMLAAWQHSAARMT